MTTIIRTLDSHHYLHTFDREQYIEDAPRDERNQDRTIRTHSVSREALSLQGLPYPVISQKQRDIQRQVCTPGLSSTKLLFLCEEEKSFMNSCNVATVFHRIAKNYKEDKRNLSSAEVDFLIDMYRDKIVNLNAQEIANTLWAMATLEIKNPGLVASLCRRAIDISSSFNEQGIANIVWSFALNKTQSTLTDDLISQLLDRIDIKKVNTATRDQLIFFLTHHRDRDYSEKRNSQRQKCLHKLYRMIESSSPSSSHIQRSVYHCLRTHFPEGAWRLEYFSKSVGYHLDIVELEQRINIEIDGQNHYLQSGNRRPADQRLDEVKERNGWKVIRIDVRGKNFKQIEEETKEKIKALTLRSQELQAPKD